MAEKQFKFKLKVALYLIFHSFELAKELVDGIDRWAVCTDDILDDYVVNMELNHREYFS